jgi:hypothetical protein
MSTTSLRAGDTVRHRPTGETWVLAYAKGDRIAWSGWPPGEAEAADCELVEAATDAQHRAALEAWAALDGRDHAGFHDSRHIECKRQLAALVTGVG